MTATQSLQYGLLDQLRAHAGDRPDRSAYRFLRDDHGSDALTFGQLARRVRALARRVRARAAPGDRALLLYPPGLEFIEAFLACLAAAVIAVPALPPGRTRNAARLRGILDSARPRLVLGTRQTLARLECEGPERLATDVACASDEDFESAHITPDTVAFLQYTSGSTAAPRGVAVTHGNLAANERAIQAAFGHTPDSVMVGWLPPFHDMGLIGQLLQPLFVGFPCVFLSPVAFLREPALWLQAISDHRGTTSGGPNFAYDHCARGVTEEQKQGLDLHSWSVAYNGAEPVRAETLDRFARAFAGCGFRRSAFFPCYGLAEATLFVSGGLVRDSAGCVWLDGPALEGHRVAEVSPGAADARPLVSCGPPGRGTRVVIVHPETRLECALGDVGEVWVASESVAAGYWGDDEATRQNFNAYLADTGEGPFLRTGDAGFLRAGEFFIAGRLKDLIILRGRNLYPQDVEAAVERAVPFARANGVAAFAVDADGAERLAVVIEADRALVHRVRADGRAAGELDTLVGRVQQAVSEELEAPVWAVAFVRPGGFPRTSSGKVQRGACRALLLEGGDEVVHLWRAGGEGLLVSESPLAAGRGLRQLIHDRLLAWRRSEGDESARAVDYHAHLTSLGVDSVGAAAIAAEVERATGHRLTPELLYQCGTIDRLARYLETRAGCVGPAQATARRGAALRERYAEQVRGLGRLRESGRYFYETTISECGGPRVKVGGCWMLMFSSYSYLGLVGHPEVNEAAKEAVDAYGAGSHGARLIAGTTEVHRRFERAIADFLGAESAVVFNTGYVTNLATVAALVGPGDCVIGDEYNHASIADGCRFSGAEALLFRHNDPASLERRLREAGGRGKLVVVDAVYSMEGDVAPLPEICELCDRHDALLMVDEAHSLGVLGATGRGVQEHFGLPAGAIDVKMGTLSKALGSCGGYIAGDAALIDHLRHAARGYLFSVAAPVPQVAAALKGLEILRREPWRVEALRENTLRFITGLRAQGFRLTDTRTPIVPVLCDTEERAGEMTARCRELGLFVVPVVYPAVPMNRPRVRASVIASHTAADIDLGLDVLRRAGWEVGVIR